MAESIPIVLAQLREYMRQLQNAHRNFGKDGPKRRSIASLSTRLDLANKVYPAICNLHMQLVVSNDDDAVAYCEEDLYSQAEDIYITYTSELQEAIEILRRPPPPVVPLLHDADVAGAANAEANANAPQQQHEQPIPLNANNNANIAANHQEFRLPTISVLVFNGDYSAWPSYRNSFEHLIANNPNLSNLQRLHYLKGSLVGDAKRLVQHYDIIDANYRAAWDKLVSRYDNKKLLVSNHLKILIHQARQSKESSSHLRLLIDTFTDSLNGLRTLDVPTAGWDPIVVHLLIEKLPVETHALWEASQMLNNELPTLANLILFLENRFRTLEAIAEKPIKIPSLRLASPIQLMIDEIIKHFRITSLHHPLATYATRIITFDIVPPL